jgi:hypothetical protein
MGDAAMIVTHNDRYSIAKLTLHSVNSIHHDDPYPQYRFGLLPAPLTAPPLAVGS